MKPIDEFLYDLSKQNIKIWGDNGRLHCNAPKGILTDHIRQEMQARKEEILHFLHSTRSPHSRQAIQPVSRTNDIPLSFAQQRLWFLDQLEGGGPTYTIPAAFVLKGKLDTTILNRCLTEVVQRHEILRTTFPMINGVPVQKISPACYVPFQVVDLQAAEKNRREAQVQELIEAESERSFDLANGPLWRLALLKVAKNNHILLLTMHHIISDGWSLAIFVREITSLYQAHLNQMPANLPDLPVQYADFSYWQRQWLTKEVLSPQINYWKQKLLGAPPVLEMPTDRPRPAVQTFQGHAQNFEFDPALTQAAKALCQGADISLLVFLLTAYAILLSRYSNQTDIVIGTPVTNRQHRETHHLIGFFLNTLALRIDLSGNPTVHELLTQVKEAFYEAQHNQDLPFERLVQEIQPERTASYMPLFQVMFVWHNDSMDQLTLPNLTISSLDAVNMATKFDLIWVISKSEDSVKGMMRYKTDLFDKSTIDRMLQHIRLLVEGMVTYPQRRVFDLPLVGADERHLLLSTWNDTQSDFSAHLCLHHLFEAQAARSPQATASVLNQKQITYGELERKANQVANYLQNLGVKRGDCIGICLERSLEMVIGLIGILKAGGAYIPLNPDHPRSRVESILEDVAAQVILTQTNIAERFAGGQQQIVCLNWDDAALAEASEARPDVDVTAQDLAYVIFTSGSTGKPKGVMVDHQAAANTIYDINERFAVGPEDRVLALSELGFDLSVYDIFGTLAAGGTVVLLPQETRREPAVWADLIASEGVTIWNSVPALMNLLVNFADTQPAIDYNSLRVVMLSGDWIPVHLPDRIRSHFINAAVFSLGGATEGAIWSIAYPIEAVDPQWTSIPYGQPLKNQRFHILNSALEPCPVGVPGELHIGGAGVALGYMKRQSLTAEKFIPDPFSNEPGARLYRTGDLGRYQPDGQIEFLGRRDFQVKIHGFRIELGEIETVLAQHTAVHQCVVMARADHQGEKRLVAYLITRQEEIATNDELRRYLATKLPPYMIPTYFIILESLPLSANGKVDRRALPLPAETQFSLAEAYVAPRDDLEAHLAQMWQTTLSVAQVGIHNNFFELGGDSIQAATLANQLQEWLGEIIYVVTLFEASTVAELAAMLREQYPQAVANATENETAVSQHRSTPAIDDAAVNQVRDLLIPILPPAFSSPEKNPPAIFILSPPRSGTTLLRVMLGSHPRLFAPPSLELLPFNTLTERREYFANGYGFWLEGLVRAIMQLRECDLATAQQIVTGWEEQQLTTQACYTEIQNWLDGKTLVDKTPSYAFETAVLERAELTFENAVYIHLLRHPYGMIHSFEKARTDQVYQPFFKQKPPFSGRELAELIWVISHQNILSFLSQIPTRRQMQLTFEEMVRQPEATAENLCHFLGLAFHPHMLQPYRDPQAQMTDGIHENTVMVGDVKFHDHAGIETAVADRWQQHVTTDFLGDLTWQLAKNMTYEKRPDLAEEAHTPEPSLQRIAEERKRRKNSEAVLTEIAQLSEDEINAMLSELLLEKEA